MGHHTPPSLFIARRGSAVGDPDRTVVWVRGEHDLATRDALVAAISRAGHLEHADLLVDLSGLTFMDASTIGAIVGSANRLRSASQSLALRSPSPSARRVLELCGLTHCMHPAGVPAPRPFGMAAALSSWVEVPPTEPMSLRDRVGASITSREQHQPVLVTTDTEVDRESA
jgi:anti-sigma B factor antagonist